MTQELSRYDYLKVLQLAFFWLLVSSANAEQAIDFSDYDLVVFGELHGTNESPAIVAKMVAELNKANKKVSLFLEIPEVEQDAVDIFADTTRTDSLDVAMSQYFWNRKIQDGRSSRAMFDLIRIAGKNGLNHIKAISPSGKQPNGGQSKSDLLLKNILDKSSKDVISVALIGSKHANHIYHTLKDNSEFKTVVLIFEYGAGTTWACYPHETKVFDCGIKQRESSYEVIPTNTFGLISSAQNSSTDLGYYFVEEISASLPLVH